MPPTIVDAIGLLIVLTVFLALVDIAKKIVSNNKLGVVNYENSSIGGRYLVK